MALKVYRSKEGLEFSISPIPKPAEGNLVFFTSAEWDWIKSSNLSSDEFRFIHLAKREDHRYSMIPDKEITDAQRYAKEYGDKILSILRGGKEIEIPEEI